MATAADLCVLALQYHQAGDLGRAEQMYRHVLQVDSNHADAHHLLGVLAFQTGHHDFALTSIGRALALNPAVASYYSNLGLVHEARGQMDDAKASFQKALELDPNNAEAHNNLANALQTLGELSDSVTHFKEALRLRPNFPEAHNNLANALQRQGKWDDAVIQFRQAIQLRPDFPEALNNLANALHHQGNGEGAISCYQEALRLKPVFPEVYCNLGIALKDQFQMEQAIACYREALRLRPNYTEAWNNLGNALMEQGQLGESVECYRRALQINSKCAEAHTNLGNIFQKQGKLEEAIDQFYQALQINPDIPEASNNLGDAMWRQGERDRAAALFRQTISLRPELAAAQSNLLLCLNYDPVLDPETLFVEHQQWGNLRVLPGVGHSFNNDPDPDRQLRIGYISPDFRQHALVRYIEPVISHHDRRLVQLFCYAQLARPDEVSKQFQGMADGWRMIRSMRDAQAADQIRADGIDILVDLAGHTADNRLGVLALKPAPIQATWLGYLNTTGLSTVDYRLTDEILDPVGQPIFDTEELLRLPDGFCCFAPPSEAPAIGPLPALGRGQLTFGSLHHLFKLNSAVFDLWSEVLHALPTAKLLMLRDTLAGKARDKVIHQFSMRGIPGSRLDLRQHYDPSNYLRVYDEIDISLDVLPWSGGVTTCESLWMGAPVLTVAGGRPAGRNSAAILAILGLHDWIVETPARFVQQAVHWAKDLDQLSLLRHQLRRRMTMTICDADRFTRGLENAFRSIWRRWCGKQSKK